MLEIKNLLGKSATLNDDWDNDAMLSHMLG